MESDFKDSEATENDSKESEATENASKESEATGNDSKESEATEYDSDGSSSATSCLTSSMEGIESRNNGSSDYDSDDIAKEHENCNKRRKQNFESAPSSLTSGSASLLDSSQCSEKKEFNNRNRVSQFNTFDKYIFRQMNRK
jgi:hypothetical protein